MVDHAESTQAGLRSRLSSLGIGFTPYYLVNGLEVDGGLLTSLFLRMQPEVDRVLPSPRLRPLPSLLGIESGELGLPSDHDWNLKMLGAEQVWSEYGARGQGIVVGQSDSGVQSDHPELADSYRGRASGSDYNWYDPWAESPAPIDFGGHGTHTLGSVLGNSVGVAPDAEWIGCANLQRNLGNPAFYLDCLQFMLAPFQVGGDPFVDGDPTRSANVLNNSWGCPEAHEGCDPTSLQPAVDALQAAGIFVVASAGNSGPKCGTVEDPIATYAEAFSVGAVDQNSNLASFSSVGPVTVDGSGRVKPDIAAPGVEVWSAFPNSTYAALDGTSMAGPHVAGVVALMWSANPALIGDIERTAEILRTTARPFSGQMSDFGDIISPERAQPALQNSDGYVQAIDTLFPNSTACILLGNVDQTPNNLVGYGIVDAYKAVQMARQEK